MLTSRRAAAAGFDVTSVLSVAVLEVVVVVVAAVAAAVAEVKGLGVERSSR